MLNTKFILALISLALICTSANAENWKDRWRNSPLTSKNSNEWRKKPYVSKTSDRWRSSPLSARQSESKLRWNKGSWQKSPTNWRNRPDVRKTVDSNSWQNRWDKKKWRDSPLNWRSSELRYKNTVEKSEGRTVSPKVKEWLPVDMEAYKEPISEEKKEYVKPQIETIDINLQTISKKTFQNLKNVENYIFVYSGNNSFKIEKNARKYVHSAPGGLIEIYSSSALICPDQNLTLQ
jgi:hypothetical protein